MKNYDKNMTKFATDVDCKDVEFTGIEILGAESKFWIEVGGKNYLYKIDDKMNFGFREVLVSFLCDSLGVDCVNAYPAFGKNTNQTGTIVENYIKDKTCTRVSLENLIVSYSDYYIQCKYDLIAYSVEEIEEILKKLENSGMEVDKTIIQKLKEMCLIDYIVLQCDRHFGNIEFLFSKKDGKTKIEIAPMFDNGRCLCYYCQNKEEIKNSRKYKIWSDVCLLMKNRPSLFIENSKYKEDYVYFIAKEILEDKRLNEIYTKICKIDFDKLVDNIAKCYPKEIEKDVLEVIKETYKIQLRTLKKYIKIAQKGDENKYKDDSIMSKRQVIPQNVSRISDIVFDYTGNNLKTLRDKNNLLLSEDNEYSDVGGIKW